MDVEIMPMPPYECTSNKLYYHGHDNIACSKHIHNGAWTLLYCGPLARLDVSKY